MDDGPLSCPFLPIQGNSIVECTLNANKGLEQYVMRREEDEERNERPWMMSAHTSYKECGKSGDCLANELKECFITLTS